MRFQFLDPHLIHGSLGPPESPPKWHLKTLSVHPFCTVHECDQQTYTGCNHATPSVAIDRNYAMHVMMRRDPKTKTETLQWQTEY